MSVQNVHNRSGIVANLLRLEGTLGRREEERIGCEVTVRKSNNNLSLRVMSSACEDSCPWTNYLSEAIDKCVLNLLSLLSTFGLTFNSDVIFDDGTFRLRESVDELVALLSFDDFQYQLLKVFLLTFASIVTLIFVAWHIYGSRISEQFMKAGVAEDFNLSTETCTE